MGLGSAVGAFMVGVVNDLLRPPAMWMIHLPIALIGIAMPVLLASMHISSAIVEAEHPTLIRVALFLQCGAISWFMINLTLFIIRFAGPVHAASLGGL